eukprot:TRINITY_DN1818_c0_g2_i1.p1 TRINITY_DN1818_c0_g2~~TRINITY_DN1818_c0_g2_i1.p1  ORF type:complete len:179 (+),score=32.51 TRINITY_DN1818_c0_g2_i1:34-537(+)
MAEAPSAAAVLPLRVLLCGDVLGRLDQLFKRVTAVNKSNGPFDCIFAVGAFFPPKLAEGEDSPIKAYMVGSKAVPIPTYFIGDIGEGVTEVLDAALMAKFTSGAEHSENGGEQGEGNGGGGGTEKAKLPGVEICPNLRCLRGAGVVEICGSVPGWSLLCRRVSLRRR